MIRQHLVRRAQVVFLLVGGVWGAVARAQSGAGDGVYSLHGTVVDGVSGKAVARALVTSEDERLAAMTDDAGRFHFEIRVPAGAPAMTNMGGRENRGGFEEGDGLILMARKPGYLAQQLPRLVAVDGSLPTTEVELRMMPDAVIAGRVTADGDEAAAGVRVSLLQHVVTGDGRWTWQQASNTNTNSHGEFRFPRLTPGEYTVASNEWRGDQPLQAQRNVAMEEYPPVFCGDARTISAAAKLEVEYGDTVRADLHLARATYYPVTIPVAAQGSDGSMVAAALDTGPMNGLALGYNERDRALEGWLPNGHYSIVLFSAAQQQGSASVELDVDGKATRTKPVTLTQRGQIQVRVHNEMTKPVTPTPVEREEPGSGTSDLPMVQDQQMVAIVLRSDDDARGMFGQNSRAGGAEGFALEGVQAGSYFVDATAFRGYVARMTSGGTDLLQQPLVVKGGGGTAPIDVTLRDDGATVTGTVSWDKGALPFRSVVFFVPEDTNGQFSQAMVGSLGKFTVENLVPGRYRAMAFPNGRAQLPYRDAEGMRPFEGKGIEVIVGPNQKQVVDVPLLDQPAPEGEAYEL